MLLILMLTSKGMAGVPRASLVVIAATDWLISREAGLILLMGSRSVLDMGRSATNVMSNAMGAAIVGALGRRALRGDCHGKPPVAVVEMAEPEPLKKAG